MYIHMYVCACLVRDDPAHTSIYTHTHVTCMYVRTSVCMHICRAFSYASGSVYRVAVYARCTSGGHEQYRSGIYVFKEASRACCFDACDAQEGSGKTALCMEFCASLTSEVVNSHACHLY